MPNTFNADGSSDIDEDAGYEYDYLSRGQNKEKQKDIDTSLSKEKFNRSLVKGYKGLNKATDIGFAAKDAKMNRLEEESEMYAERAKRATKD